MGTSERLAAVFVWYKNSLRPQANNSLSCTWNNSYYALGPTLAASMWYMCIFQLTTKSMQSAALFLKMGKWLWHFPQPRFLPRSGLWESPCCARPLGQQAPHFAWIHFSSLGSSEFSNNFSGQNVRRVALARDSFYPNWDIKVTFYLENGSNHLVTIFIGRPTFEESTSNCLTVGEQDYSVGTNRFFPASKGCKYCHHFQLLNHCLLTLGQYVIQSDCVHSRTEERDDFLRHVDQHAT